MYIFLEILKPKYKLKEQIIFIHSYFLLFIFKSHNYQKTSLEHECQIVPNFKFHLLLYTFYI